MTNVLLLAKRHTLNEWTQEDVKTQSRENETVCPADLQRTSPCSKSNSLRQTAFLQRRGWRANLPFSQHHGLPNSISHESVVWICVSKSGLDMCRSDNHLVTPPESDGGNHNKKDGKMCVKISAGGFYIAQTKTLRSLWHLLDYVCLMCFCWFLFP